jgi:NAD(P)H-quinone oxidoreductase subunit 4L
MSGAETAAVALTVNHYLGVATFLFVIGFAGVVSSRHLIRTLMCVELMLNAVNLVFVSINNHVNPGDVSGQIFAMFVLTISAAEAAVGLAIVLALFKNTATVDLEHFKNLKW